MSFLCHIFISSVQNLFQIPVSMSDGEGDESETSEEEYEMIFLSKKRKLAKPCRISNYLQEIVPSLTAQQFQQHFRVTIDAYEHLLGMIGLELSRRTIVGRSTLNSEKQILAVLWLLATPDSYRSVGERFNIAKSSLSVCFVRVIKVLNSLAPQVIKWPEGERLNNIKQKFADIAQLENVIGAVDGTYIQIKAPKDDPQSYVTRKCNYAFTLQAVADSDLLFIDAFIGYPGSVSDTRIFKNSDIYRAIRNNVGGYFPNNTFIIGDKAYPLLSWCIRPYINRGQLTPAQIHFNTVHAKTRQVIERAFSLLFGRFRRLKYLDMNRNDLIPGTALAACVLHNICLNHMDHQVNDYIEEGVNNVINEDDVNVAIQHAMEEEGRNIRNNICRNLYLNRNRHL